MTEDIIVWTLLYLAAVLGFASLALWVVESLDRVDEEEVE